MSHVKCHMSRIRKAVLPVAGMGTRFMPATKVVPKELLPIVDKPVIQYLVEEAVLSGVEEVIFVISPGKELIRDHFSHHPELEALLKERGKHHVADKLSPIHNMARFSYVYQHEPLGDGHAILMAEQEVGNEPFVVLFGDDIVKHSVPATKQLMNHFTGESILAVERIPREQTTSYGVIRPGQQNGRLYEILGMVEKPHPDEAPSDLGVIGKYICPPEIFQALKEAQPGKDGEIRLIDGLIRLKDSQNVWAVEIEGDRFDTGKPEGLSAASSAYLEDAL